jgi:uncharacterized glyoxalase superfamily protein PhnB
MPERALDELLDQAIDALFAGAPPAAEPELASLAALAADLRYLPDENFQKRLKSDLERKAIMTTAAAPSLREGFHTVNPYITVPDGAQFIEFLKRTFDAQEVVRHTAPMGFQSEVRIGDTMLMIGSAEAVRGHEKVGAFHVYVPDCDAVYNRALEAGATSLGAPSDHHYGERAGYVKDPAGNDWYIATHLGATPALESRWMVTPFVHPSSVPKYIEFLTRAFGASQLALYEDAGRVVYAAVSMGDAVVEMSQPHDAAETPRAGFYLYVEDCDQAYRNALEAGATSLWAPTDQPYGDRNAGVVDPFGYQWFPATQISRAR